MVEDQPRQVEKGGRDVRLTLGDAVAGYTVVHERDSGPRAQAVPPPVLQSVRSSLTPLMPATATATDVLSPMAPRHGVEREIVVMFADLRNFTRLSESRLPYDTVFILNRYFGAMGSAIEQLLPSDDEEDGAQ